MIGYITTNSRPLYSTSPLPLPPLGFESSSEHIKEGTKRHTIHVTSSLAADWTAELMGPPKWILLPRRILVVYTAPQHVGRRRTVQRMLQPICGNCLSPHTVHPSYTVCTTTNYNVHRPSARDKNIFNSRSNYLFKNKKELPDKNDIRHLRTLFCGIDTVICVFIYLFIYYSTRINTNYFVQYKFYVYRKTNDGIVAWDA